MRADAGMNEIEEKQAGKPGGGTASEVGDEGTADIMADAPATRDEAEAIGEALHHRRPGEPELRPSVQQQDRWPLACFGDMKHAAECGDGAVADHGAEDSAPAPGPPSQNPARTPISTEAPGMT